LQSEVNVFFLIIIVLLRICVESRTWSKPVTSATGPSPRDKLASAAIGQNIYYFGGFGPKTSAAVRNYVLPVFFKHNVY